MTQPISIYGYNSFYHGWLLWLLMKPLPEDADERMRQGFKIAGETGPEAAEVLRAEIELGHIIVEIA